MSKTTGTRDDLASPAELAAAAAIANGSRPGRRTPGQLAAMERARVELLACASENIEAVVIHAHRSRRRTGVDLDDLRQEALGAVWAATLSWDPVQYPSWRAYAGSAVRRRLNELLDGDDNGRHLTRATARLLRHARGVRAAAECRGEHLGVEAVVTAVVEAGRARAAERGVDPETAMRRNGERAAIDRDLAMLLGEGPAVRLDAPVDEEGTTFAEIVAAPCGSTDLGPLADLLAVIDPADRATLISDSGRTTKAKERALARLGAPHLQWARLGPIRIVDAI